MRKIILKILSVVFIFSALFLTSCDDMLGYGVVLWNVPEYGIQAGQVVPVFIKSNISHVYVIGLEDGQKVEIPLWQLTEPVAKKKIEPVAQKYQEYSSWYASVKLDGLPCRAEAVNTAKQVYRLRKGEVIKILYQGKGQQVMAGKNALEGNWYKILTDNGTEGWCFSYNLNLYEVGADGSRIGGEEIVAEVESDETMDQIFTKVWYPDYFSTMIKSGNIDISRLIPSYKFTVDTENNKVSLNMNKIHENWTYTGYTKTGDKQYTFKDIPLIVYYKRSDFIVLRYTGESGKPQELNFVTIDQDLNEIIANEKQRRIEELEKVVRFGPKFSSGNYGTLVFDDDGSFKWTNNKLLVPSVISSDAKHVGMVSVKYAVSKELSSVYQGVLTFKFDGMSNEVNFLYKMEEGGLRLEDATRAKVNGSMIEGRGAGALIMYFQN